MAGKFPFSVIARAQGKGKETRQCCSPSASRECLYGSSYLARLGSERHRNSPAEV